MGMALPVSDRPKLSLKETLILGKVFERKAAPAIATEMKMSVAAVRRVLNSPHFRAEVEVHKERVLAYVDHGEFGLMATIKANAMGALRRVIGLSKDAKDERVRFAANKWLVELAGLQPPKPAPAESPEDLVRDMTPDELDHFSLTAEFPARMHDRVARLVSSVLQTAEQQRRETRRIDLSPVEDPDGN